MKLPTCINLAARFGDRYRIGFDPVYDPRHRPKDKLDPWMMVLPCSRGRIYPHGDDLLAVHVEGHRLVRGKLKRLGLTLHGEGDDEATFLFPLDRFDEVAKIVRPYRRPQLSVAERERRRERMQEIRQQTP